MNDAVDGGQKPVVNGTEGHTCEGAADIANEITIAIVDLIDVRTGGHHTGAHRERLRGLLLRLVQSAEVPAAAALTGEGRD